MFKKIRFFFLYIKYFLRKNYIYLIIGLSVGVLGFLKRDQIISIVLAVSAKPKTVGIEGQYTFDKLPKIVSEKISYGLTIATEKGKMEPSPIIESIDVSNDNLTYTFTFISNLYWHNQKKFSTQDLTINIPGTNSKIISNTQLQVNLNSPYSAALSLFTKPVFMNKTAYGLGPYKTEKINYQDGYIKDISLKSIKDGQKIVYKFYSNEKDLYNAFRLGQVNQIITSQLPNNIELWPKLKIDKSIDTNQNVLIYINTEKITNKQTRQALAYATRKNNDKNIRSISPISPNSWAYNPAIKEYNFNVTRAKEFIGKDPITNMTLVVTNRKLLEIAESIKKDWKDVLGIDVTIIISSIPKEGQYDSVLTYAPIPTDPDQYAFWHSTQSQTNISKLNNSRIDKLLEEGRLVFDQIERKKIYFDFQKYLLEESPAIFLEFPTIYTITKSK